MKKSARPASAKQVVSKTITKVDVLKSH